MGGISGIYCSFRNSGIVTTYRMIYSLQHRGFDNIGFFTDEYIALAHNCSGTNPEKTQAKQPKLSNCKRYVIIYNGEVFNCQELVKKYNLVLNSDSEAEIILELFIRNGTSFVNELNGAFTFAIYDREKTELFLYRDRLGLKPLFYTQNADSFIFGSELKALLTIPEVKNSLTINYDAVNRYFHLGYIPAPQTIYQNVHKLEQGSMLKVSYTSLESKKWWDIDNKIFCNHTINNEQHAIDHLDELLNDSVKKRISGHKQVGALLSGGIDSSLISAMAAIHANEPINTFCVRFDGFKDINDESIWAYKISKHIGSKHNLLNITLKDAEEYIPKMIHHYDEPYADSSAIPTMLVSKVVSEHFPFVLTGDGGDELFHGYGAYFWAERLNSLFVRNFKSMIGEIMSLGNSRMQRASWMFQSNPHIQAHIFSQEQYLFSDSELHEILSTDYSTAWIPTMPNPDRKLTPGELQAIYDLKYYLTEDLLTKMDRGSMLFGLETRAPLLDHRIVEWSLNLSPELKIRDKKGKYILRQLITKYIPADVFNRPKRGFAAPMKEWMRNDLKTTFLNYLSPEIIQKYNIVNYKPVERLKHEFYKKNIDYLYNRLWLIAAFHMWLEQSVFNKNRL